MELVDYIAILDREGPCDPTDLAFSASIRDTKIERFILGKSVAEDSTRASSFQLRGRTETQNESLSASFYQQLCATQIQAAGGCCGHLSGPGFSSCLHSPGFQVCPRVREAKEVSSFVDRLLAWLDERPAVEQVEERECLK